MRNEEKRKHGLVNVFTKKIKLKNGKVIYAHNYGLKAFSIWVKPRS